LQTVIFLVTLCLRAEGRETKPIPLLFDSDQLADQVIGWMLAFVGDQASDVVPEGAHMGCCVPALPNKRFEPTPRARMLTPEVIERGSNATRWALIGDQLRSDNLAK